MASSTTAPAGRSSDAAAPAVAVTQLADKSQSPVAVVDRDTVRSDAHPAPILAFDGNTVRFDRKTALDDVSFTVKPGDTVVIYGAAGSGKTILLKTAIGLICPDAGRVLLFGQSIGGLREEQLFPLRRRVGMLFQEGGLFDSLTVAENVSFPLVEQRAIRPSPAEIEQRVKEALSFVDLGQTMDKYPAELSGGMRRRVAIARASVTRPPLILYDSPTAGLDPITAARIMELAIRQRDAAGTTTLLVTHRHQDGKMMSNYRYDCERHRLVRSEEAHCGTRFIVLREGRLVFEGREEELLSSKDAYVMRFAGAV